MTRRRFSDGPNDWTVTLPKPMHKQWLLEVEIDDGDKVQVSAPRQLTQQQFDRVIEALRANRADIVLGDASST